MNPNFTAQEKKAVVSVVAAFMGRKDNTPETFLLFSSLIINLAVDDLSPDETEVLAKILDQFLCRPCPLEMQQAFLSALEKLKTNGNAR